jgi:ppGpp synthetase/RelA/SpoT-type nucleotidyltranferase
MMSRSQIERLGIRLAKSPDLDPSDLAALHKLLVIYGDALAEAVRAVDSDLGITPTARIKTTGTILEKLERLGGSWLKSIHDIAGMRIVGTFDRKGQDALVARLVELFADGSRSPEIVDRRVTPSHGYRAVHVIVVVRSIPVEIQVRTQLQNEWADLFEKLADKIGRSVRYGEPPQHWLTAVDRDALSESPRDLYWLEHRLRCTVADHAQSVAGMIEAYERGEILAPNDPELQEYRLRVDDALAAFTGFLNRL